MKKRKSIKKHSKKPVKLSEIKKRLLKKKELIEYIRDEFDDIQQEMVEDSFYDKLRHFLKELIKQEIAERDISNEDDKIKVRKEVTDEFNDYLKGSVYYELREGHRDLMIENYKYTNKTEAIVKLLNKISDDD